MTEQRFEVWDVEKRVMHSGIAYIRFGRPDKALGSGGAPGFETPRQHQVHQKIETAGDRLSAHSEGGSQPGSGEDLSLVVPQHSPEPIQSL